MAGVAACEMFVSWTKRDEFQSYQHFEGANHPNDEPCFLHPLSPSQGCFDRGCRVSLGTEAEMVERLEAAVLAQEVVEGVGEVVMQRPV